MSFADMPNPCLNADSSLCPFTSGQTFAYIPTAVSEICQHTKCCLHTDSRLCGDRTLQQAPAEGIAPNLHAASHLTLLAMASDAHALHHWNQQEWGQTHTRKTAAASLTSESCSPALWQVGTKHVVIIHSPCCFPSSCVIQQTRIN